MSYTSRTSMYKASLTWELEDQDIIERKVYAEVPPKVEYSITEYGRSLYNILQGMHEWGASHLEHMAQKKMKM